MAQTHYNFTTIAEDAHYEWQLPDGRPAKVCYDRGGTEIWQPPIWVATILEGDPCTTSGMSRLIAVGLLEQACR